MFVFIHERTMDVDSLTPLNQEIRKQVCNIVLKRGETILDLPSLFPIHAIVCKDHSVRYDVSLMVYENGELKSNLLIRKSKYLFRIREWMEQNPSSKVVQFVKNENQVTCYASAMGKAIQQQVIDCSGTLNWVRISIQNPLSFNVKFEIAEILLYSIYDKQAKILEPFGYQVPTFIDPDWFQIIGFRRSNKSNQH